MKMRYNHLLLIAVLTSLLLSALPAWASLEVEGSRFEADVSPGDSLSHEMTIALTKTNTTQNISVDVLGYGQGLDGAVIGLVEKNDNSPYSARAFLKVSPASVQLQPGVSQKVVLDADIPEDVGSGSRYALAFIHTDPEGEKNVKIVVGVYVPIILNIKDTEKTTTCEIETLRTEEPFSSERQNTSLIFKNTGNTRYNIVVEGLLKDKQGKVHANASESTIIPIIPMNPREFRLKFTPDQKLDPGTYQIEEAVKLEDGTIIASEVTEFKI